MEKRMNIIGIQSALKRAGFDPGPLDGVRGAKTDAAIIAFKKSIGYRATTYIGPLTKAALFEGRIDKARNDKQMVGSAKDPAWLKLARTYLGLREYRGSRHNAKILSWWSRLGLGFRDDETPWCAGFVNGVMDECGFKLPPKKYRAAALGWRWTGHGTRLPGPAYGSIVDMTRRGKPGFGHTGFVVGRDRFRNIMVLGGNQGDCVSIKPFDIAARDGRFYWPDGAPIPAKTGMETLPLIDSDGRVSRNEA